jgi:hypothetical protein
MMYTQPANHSSRRSFLRIVGGLGSLALAPWSRSLGAQSRVTNLLILLPGITGSALQKNKKDVWGVTTDGVGGALTSLGRNLQGLELKDDVQDVEDLGDGRRVHPSRRRPRSNLARRRRERASRLWCDFPLDIEGPPYQQGQV